MIKKTDKPSIAIIGCYYGAFPKWIQYWLKSCSMNPTIDFYIVTDITLDNLPDNVKIISLSLLDMKTLASQALGMNVVLDRPYKLCDLRPFFGIIFHKYIADYDYWGHCDFDLIWGDIRKFVNKYNLENYDKFLPLGHLSLYRNTFEVNARYKLNGSNTGDYKTVLTSSRSYAFDETDGIYSIYKENGFSMFEKRIFAEIKTFHKRFRLKYIDKNYKNQVFYFKNGSVYRAYEDSEIKFNEYIYIHFRRKLKCGNKKWSEIDDFYISKDGMIDSNIDVPTVKDMERYNHNPGRIIEWLETGRFIINNIGKVKSKIENEIIAYRQKNN